MSKRLQLLKRNPSHPKKPVNLLSLRGIPKQSFSTRLGKVARLLRFARNDAWGVTLKRLTRLLNQLPTWMFAAISVAASVMALIFFLDHLGFEFQGPWTWDTPIYWAVGRGILNGLIPYRDLFDVKPPGIFLVSALSFGIDNSPRIGSLLAGLALTVTAGIPLILAARRKYRSLAEQTTAYFISLALGSILGAYLGVRSGEFQVEAFALPFVLLYVLLLDRAASQPQGVLIKTQIGLAGILIFLAAGFKEPFLLASAVAALVSTSTARQFFRNFVIPAILAVGLGLVALGALGWLKPYLAIYLPEIFLIQLHSSLSWWQRGFQFRQVWQDLAVFSPILPWLTSGLIASATVLQFRWEHTTLRRIMVIFKMALSVYITVLIIAIRGVFYTHHFVLIIPLLLACLMVVFRSEEEHRHHLPSTIAIGLVLLTALTAFTLPPLPNYQLRLEEIRRQTTTLQNAAATIDTVLSRCGEDRYLFLGFGPQPYGYTKHSPLGPMFAQFSHMLDPRLPELRNGFLAQLAAAQIAVVAPEIQLRDLEAYTQNYLTANFTRTPPSCAGAGRLSELQGYTFYFRTVAGQR